MRQTYKKEFNIKTLFLTLCSQQTHFVLYYIIKKINYDILHDTNNYISV